MIIDLNKMKEITCGAVSITEKDGFFEFDRFDARQYENQIKCSADFYNRSLSSSGVRIAVRTDSEYLGFDYKIFPASSDPRGYFDIYINGVMIAHIGGVNETAGKAEVKLGKGEKKLEVYFPWSKRVLISNPAFDDGALVTPVKRPLKLLTYGDSITQGYCAEYPSLTYISRLASMLDADVLNKAIGGDGFSDRIISSPDEIEPDIITVAYGTNDWKVQTVDNTAKSIRRFFSLLRGAYPKAKIFAISPLWRTDHGIDTQFHCDAEEVDALICENVKGIYDIICIRGWDMIPHLPEFFADHVHPNDLSFGIYVENLYKRISKYI